MAGSSPAMTRERNSIASLTLAMTGSARWKQGHHLPRRPLAAVLRPMGGGEKIRRGRFAGKEKSAVERRGEHGAGAGVARQRMRVGAAGERVLRPARFRQRLQAAAIIRAEHRHDFVDGLRGERAFAGIFKLARKAPAE